MNNKKYTYDGLIVGENIRTARKNMGLSSEQLAELLDKSVHHVSKVELGWNKVSIDLLMDLVSVLHTDANTLLGIEKDNEQVSIDGMLEKMDPAARKYLSEVMVGMIQNYPK